MGKTENETEKKRVWVNLGDINFTTYGGSLVSKHWSDEENKKYPSLSGMYDVFTLNTEAGDNGDQLSAAMMCVDVYDIDQETKKSILQSIGLESKIQEDNDEIMSKERWAKELADAGYGGQAESFTSQYPSEWKDFIISEEDLKKWMTLLEADEFLPKEETK